MLFIRRYISRKFVLTLLMFLTVYKLPLEFKTLGVSDNVTMMVLGILGAIGVAYGFVNIRDPKP